MEVIIACGNYLWGLVWGFRPRLGRLRIPAPGLSSSTLVGTKDRHGPGNCGIWRCLAMSKGYNVEAAAGKQGKTSLRGSSCWKQPPCITGPSSGLPDGLTSDDLTGQQQSGKIARRSLDHYTIEKRTSPEFYKGWRYVSTLY